MCKHSHTGYCTVPEFNNKTACEGGKGEWKKFMWGIHTPDCDRARWTRDNHLGNTQAGESSSYNWTIPNDPK